MTQNTRTTYTPGPWTYHAPMNPTARPFVTRADGYTVAECMIAGESDARLIAAAPDLLAALHAVLESNSAAAHDFGAQSPQHQEAVRASQDHAEREARAAIARADGGA